MNSVDLGVTWEPNVPDAELVARDDGTTLLILSAHPDDNDQRRVVLEWGRSRLARMEPPNDEARSGHRLYGAGLANVLWIGEVTDSQDIAALERANRVHPRHDASRYAGFRHWIVPLKECTIEVVARSIAVKRQGESGEE